MRSDYNVNHTSNEIFFNKNKIFSTLIQIFSKISVTDWYEIATSKEDVIHDRVYDRMKLFDHLSKKYSNQTADKVDVLINELDVSRLDIEFIVAGYDSRTQTFPIYTAHPLIRPTNFSPTVEIDFSRSTYKSPFFFTTLLRELKRAGIYDYDATSSRGLMELLSLTLWTMNFVGRSTLGDPETYHNSIGVTAQVIRRWNFGPEAEVISDRDRMSACNYNVYSKDELDGLDRDIYRLNQE
jgi:hypothetical protein